MKALKDFFSEKPEDKYKRGFASAITSIELNPSEENIMEQYRIALSDIDQDPFTRGWLVACRKKMQALYNKDID